MKLENNSVHIKEDLPYKTMYRMAPKSSKEFEFISKHYYNFMIVRHPFRRLISAYNNRVKGCEMSAKWYTTGWFSIFSFNVKSKFYEIFISSKCT